MHYPEKQPKMVIDEHHCDMTPRKIWLPSVPWPARDEKSSLVSATRSPDTYRNNNGMCAFRKDMTLNAINYLTLATQSIFSKPFILAIFSLPAKHFFQNKGLEIPFFDWVSGRKKFERCKLERQWEWNCVKNLSMPFCHQMHLTAIDNFHLDTHLA